MSQLIIERPKKEINIVLELLNNEHINKEDFIREYRKHVTSAETDINRITSNAKDTIENSGISIYRMNRAF